MSDILLLCMPKKDLVKVVRVDTFSTKKLAHKNDSLILLSRGLHIMVW